MNTQTYDRLPLSSFKPLFATLSSPEIHSLTGFYHGQLTGPLWLRMIDGLYLRLIGLGNWLGKDFHLNGEGINLVQQHGKTKRVFPFRLVETTSRLDGKPVVAIHYQKILPIPWPVIVDELRLIETGSLLGISYHNLPVVRRIAAPFLLLSQEASHGN